MNRRVAQVLIIHRDEFVREGLAAIVQRHPNAVICGKLEPRSESVELARSRDPDILIVEGGAEVSTERVFHALRAACPRAQLVAFVPSPADSSHQKLRSLGASTILTSLDGAGRLEQVVDQAIERRGGAATPLLTPRENEVLSMLVNGLSNREIASSLYIAEGTVKRHTSNIYGKLQVTSRIAAAVRAREGNFLRSSQER